MLKSSPYWSNHEVAWESRVAYLNRYFDLAAQADECAKRLAANPNIIKVVRLEHDGPHGKSPTIRTIVKDANALAAASPGE